MKIIVLKKAQKQLNNLDKKIKEKIVKAIFKIPNGDIKPLQGTKDKFRIRVGDYRVLYLKTDTAYKVYKIATREQIYKGRYL